MDVYVDQWETDIPIRKRLPQGGRTEQTNTLVTNPVPNNTLIVISSDNQNYASPKLVRFRFSNPDICRRFCAWIRKERKLTSANYDMYIVL